MITFAKMVLLYLGIALHPQTNCVSINQLAGAERAEAIRSLVEIEKQFFVSNSEADESETIRGILIFNACHESATTEKR
jgi:hypothetical protein